MNLLSFFRPRSQANEHEHSPLDAHVTHALAKQFGVQSRRAFISMVSRKMIGMTGMVLAAEALPFFPSTAIAGEMCGLHGWACGVGNCIKSGGTLGLAWLQCCSDTTACGIVQCCSYRDYCGASSPPPASGCVGPGPSGPSWCGTAGMHYICTEITCTGNYQSITDCSQSCGPCPYP